MIVTSFLTIRFTSVALSLIVNGPFSVVSFTKYHPFSRLALPFLSMVVTVTVFVSALESSAANGIAAKTANATARTAIAARSFLEALTPPPGAVHIRFHFSFLRALARIFGVLMRYSCMAHACPVPSQADINPERGAVRDACRTSGTTRIPLQYPRYFSHVYESHLQTHSMPSQSSTAPHPLLQMQRTRDYREENTYNLRPMDPPCRPSSNSFKCCRIGEYDLFPLGTVYDGLRHTAQATD